MEHSGQVCDSASKDRTHSGLSSVSILAAGHTVTGSKSKNYLCNFQIIYEKIYFVPLICLVQSVSHSI